MKHFEPKKRNLNHRKGAGFTLIELSVIIGIMGILALIGIPVFRSYQPSLQLSGTVRDLVTDLRYAGRLAIDEQVNHGIRFSTSTSQYQIIKFKEPEEVLKTKFLPQEVSFSLIAGFTNSQAIFNPYGAAIKQGSITLVNTKNSTITVEVRPSGFVKVIK